MEPVRGFMNTHTHTQIVAQHPQATMELVRGFMQRSLESDMSSMSRNRAAIQAYQEETAHMRLEIERYIYIYIYIHTYIYSV